MVVLKSTPVHVVDIVYRISYAVSSCRKWGFSCLGYCSRQPPYVVDGLLATLLIHVEGFQLRAVKLMQAIVLSGRDCGYATAGSPIKI